MTGATRRTSGAPLGSDGDSIRPKAGAGRLLWSAGRGGLVAILIVALLGSVVACTGAWYWHARNVSDARAQFHATSSELAVDLTTVLTRDGALLAGSAALFDQGVVTRAQYTSYLQAVGFGTARFPEIHGVGFIQSIGAGQLATFLTSLRANGINVASVAPAGQRARYCLGSYADWTDFKSAIPLFGYDFCTVAVLDHVLTLATDSGKQQALPGSQLGPKYASDFLLVQAVYNGVPTTPSAREEALRGWALAIGDGPELLQSVPSQLAVQFLVTSEPKGARGSEPMLRSPASVKSSDSWSLSRDIYAYGTWTVRFRPAPGSSTAGDPLPIGPIGLLVMGLLGVGLLVALMTSLVTARRRALRMVRRATRSLQSSEERYRTLTGAAPIGILEVVPAAMVIYANPRMADICGRDISALMGTGWIDALHPEDVPDFLALADRIRPDRSTVARVFRILRPDGEVRHVRMTAAPKGQDVATGYVVTIEDITEEVTAQEALAHQVFYDSLTGLPNRALFDERLTLEVARRRRGGSKFAVLFLDLDGFKHVNDSLGHEAGDVVLQEVGRRLAGGVRAGETAARFSGDEFVFIIHVGDDSDALGAAERILAIVQLPIRCAGRELTVTASVGIVIPSDDLDLTTLLRDADTAMYHAKEAGRNRYSLFSDNLHYRSVARLEVEGELRQALASDEFEFFYQPAVELATDKPFAAEALIRWHHPTRGLVSPREFIPVAEACGLIKPIGQWVLEQAVSQLASWDAQATGPRLSVLSVNLSASQLDDPATAEMVSALLDRYHVDPRRLSIEVTESMLMADNRSTRRTLERFKELGVRVTIDDFGTGYSSLAYLHTLPVTTMKIDRSFIERLGSDDDSTPVVRAIVEMGHAMRLRVVAEGVTNGHLRSLVSALGCDLAQGFFCAIPMPPEEFVVGWQNALAVSSEAPKRAAQALAAVTAR